MEVVPPPSEDGWNADDPELPKDPEPPPPQDDQAPVQIHEGRIQIRGIVSSSLLTVAKLLRNPDHRELVLGSSEPLRLNEMTQGITHSGADVQIDQLAIEVRLRAEERIHVETKAMQPDGRPVMVSLKLTQDVVRDAICAVARESSYHPVRDYLNSVEAQPNAIARMGREVLGLSDDRHLAILRKWAISAVARAFEPGCKVDTVLILVGPQGGKKSSFFDALADPWFVDSNIDITNKDSFDQMHRAWIYEWGELTVFRKAEVESLKGFISSRVDTYCPRYGRSSVSFPRSSVIVGSTNDQTFLKDPTGNRRFWPLTVSKSIDLLRVKAWRDAFWGEAVACYRSGIAWHFEDNDPAMAALAEAHERHMVADDWEADVAEYVFGKAEANTRDILINSRVSSRIREITPRESARVAAILKSLGWTPGARYVLNGVRTYPWHPQGRQGRQDARDATV
jgi:putative DNA primase/helicase